MHMQQKKPLLAKLASICSRIRFKPSRFLTTPHPTTPCHMSAEYTVHGGTNDRAPEFRKIGRTSEINALAKLDLARLRETTTHLTALTDAHYADMVDPEKVPVMGDEPYGRLYLLGETFLKTVAQLTTALEELERFSDVDRYVLTATNYVDAMRRSALADVMEGLRVHYYARADFTKYFDIAQLIYKRTTELTAKLCEIEAVYAKGDTLHEKCPDTDHAAIP